jgi:hypothetical protein
VTVTDMLALAILSFVVLVLSAIIVPEFLRRPSMKP